MSTTTRTRPWQSRTVGAFASIVLAGAALTACGSGAAEEAPAESGTTAEAASDGGGSADATTASSTEGESSTASPSEDAESSGSAATASASGDAIEPSESFLFRASEPGDGDISVSGGYGIIGEPLTREGGSTKVTKADNLELMDSASSGYTVDCEKPLELGGDPVPCTYDKDGTVLKGEAIFAPVAGSENAIVIGHIEGSSDGDKPLAATGEEGVLAAYYADGEGGPDVVTKKGLEDTLVYAYSLGGDGEDPSRIEGVTARCELEDDALEVACVPSAEGLDGYYRAAYHPGADGRPFYVFVPTGSN